jgi:hypothetical protein
MKTLIVPALFFLAFCAFPVGLRASADFIGYSGAPGSGGNCASSCHGTTGGTVGVTGFPTQYVPGQVYTVTVSHSGGSTIRQFNGSCRVGTGSTNAGVIAAGTDTEVYNTAGETNGVHLAASSLDAATFLWTAPPQGTGTVRLYLAGHQGNLSGPNTDLVLTAVEMLTGVDDETSGLPAGLSIDNYPNPFEVETTIGYALAEPGPVRLEIFSLSGRLLESFAGNQPAGFHHFTWRPVGVPSGIYLYRVQVGEHTATKKMILTR